MMSGNSWTNYVDSEFLTKRLVESDGRRHDGPWEDPAMAKL
jgi:hypothetical protein